MRNYDFTVVLHGMSEIDDDLAEALFQTGCTVDSVKIEAEALAAHP